MSIRTLAWSNRFLRITAAALAGAWLASGVALADDLMSRSTRGLGEAINEDPLKLRDLFGLPPDFSSEIENPEHPARVAHGWLGVTIKEGKPVFLPGAKDVSPSIEILQVFPGSPAETARLRPGDRIITTNGEGLSLGEQNSLLMNFRHRIKDAGTGQPFRLGLFRGGKVQEQTLILEPRPALPVTLKSHPDWLDRPIKKDSLLHRLLRRERLLEDFGLTLEEIRERSAQVVSTAVKGETYNPFRLQEVNTALHRPMDLPLLALDWVDGLHKHFQEDFMNPAGLVGVAMDGLDVARPGKTPPPPASLAEWIDRVLTAMERAEATRQAALKNLGTGDMEFLIRELHRMLDTKAAPPVSEEEKAADELRQLMFLRIALKVDLPRLLAAGRDLAAALDLAALLRFKDKVGEFSPYREGWVIEETGNRTLIHTPKGLVVVGGTGDNQYEEDAVLIVDLGGNDRYLNSSGGSGPGRPFSVILDFSGNDVYLSNDPVAQGAGLFGGGYLIDLDGDDRYQADGLAQGAAFFGVGLLVDVAGNDQYSCRAFCQGAGFFGAGLLAEGGGNDQYRAAIYAQGFGFVKGFGALVELSGEDYYFAGGEVQDHREPGKAYQSMSQGFGLGIRPWESIAGASGGIGILADDAGNDTYIADYFAQGASYWYSLGILADRQGHDKYLAGRYSQGAGIHYSAGTLIDESGDDEYIAHFGVSQGCGHDLAVGFLLDNGGNDRYISGVIAQGAGNANGIGFLNDNGGSDEYHVRDMGQGRGQFESLRELGSFGFLVDTGGDEDFYNRRDANNKTSVQTQWGFLIDIP